MEAKAKYFFCSGHVRLHIEKHSIGMHSADLHSSSLEEGCHRRVVGLRRTEALGEPICGEVATEVRAVWIVEIAQQCLQPLRVAPW